MSDNMVDDTSNGEEENFADLFESYSAGMNENIQIGDRIEGKIIAVGSDTVFIDTGTKIDGAVDKAELLDEKGELPHQVGDTLELYVVAMDESEIRLSRALSGIGGLNMLREAFETRVPVEGKVLETCKGGFRVEVLKRRAFCPVSQIDARYVETPDDYVGQSLEFLITRFEESGRNIVVSRRELLNRQQQEAAEAYIKTVSAGSVVDGRVTRLMPYGAFVELTPGIEGMVHISELSWSRVEKPEDVVGTGDPLTVKILDIQDGKKPGELKISLSVKQISGDPWDRETQPFAAGDKIQGRVTRLMPFGAFVEISPGIEGLVHISEMSYTKRVNKPEEVVSPGETVSVLVKDIDLAKRRISLSIRDAEGDPWATVSDNYEVGQLVTGTVEKKEAFGFFVTLEPGITGLLPKSKISRSETPAKIERLREGDAITVKVEEIRSRERKITLGTGDSNDETEWKNFAADSGGALSPLAEKLQQALKGKNLK